MWCENSKAKLINDRRTFYTAGKNPTVLQNENKEKFGMFATSHQGKFSLFCFTCVRALIHSIAVNHVSTQSFPVQNNCGVVLFRYNHQGAIETLCLQIWAAFHVVHLYTVSEFNEIMDCDVICCPQRCNISIRETCFIRKECDCWCQNNF